MWRTFSDATRGWRWPRRVSWLPKGWLLGGGAILFVVATIGVARWDPLTDLARGEQVLRNLVATYPVLSWCVGFLLYFLLGLVPGTRGKAILFGWLFGFWPALIQVNVALTGAALVGFHLSRWLFRDAVMARYEWQLERINRALATQGAEYVILLRVVPISFSLTNYLLGATTLRARTFWWGTHVGLLPGNAVFIYLGAHLPSLTAWHEQGWTAVVTPELLGALGLGSLFVLVAPWLARRRTQAAS